MTPLGRPRSEC